MLYKSEARALWFQFALSLSTVVSVVQQNPSTRAPKTTELRVPRSHDLFRRLTTFYAFQRVGTSQQPNIVAYFPVYWIQASQSHGDLDSGEHRTKSRPVGDDDINPSALDGFEYRRLRSKPHWHKAHAGNAAVI